MFFKVALARNLEYRGELFTWILVELTAVMSSVFIWMAIYRTNNMVGSYDMNRLLSYYLLIPVIAAFTTVFISEGLPRKIKDGEISADIIKPFSFAGVIFVNNISVLLIKQALKLPVYILVLYVSFFLFGLTISLPLLLFAIFIALFSFVLHFFLDMCLSYAAFWMDDAWSLSHLKFVCLLMFGGQAFPLDLVPAGGRWLFELLPFRFVYYFPLSVALGRVNVQEFVWGFTQLLIWTMFFYVLHKILWNKGLKKYGAYGN